MMNFIYDDRNNIDHLILVSIISVKNEQLFLLLNK